MHGPFHPSCRAAALMIALGLASLASPALADQLKETADGGTIDCQVSARELTRFSLIGDGFASVSKIGTGTPYNDFAVTNEPVRGDIYVSVPEVYAAARISFFATTKKGYVYKFTWGAARLMPSAHTAPDTAKVRAALKLRLRWPNALGSRQVIR